MTTRISSNNITSGSITADLLSATAISDKLGYVPATETQVNTAITLAQSAYNQANTGGGGSSGFEQTFLLMGA
jgi:hypothetical protein